MLTVRIILVRYPLWDMACLTLLQKTRWVNFMEIIDGLVQANTRPVSLYCSLDHATINSTRAYIPAYPMSEQTYYSYPCFLTKSWLFLFLPFINMDGVCNYVDEPFRLILEITIVRMKITPKYLLASWNFVHHFINCILQNF